MGLSTTALTATHFSGGRAAVTWVQVAARGSPVLSLPVPQGTCVTKTQPTVTAYKDRVITVRLKDYRVTQHFQMLSAVKIRQQVEMSIRNCTATKSVAVMAAHQLKSSNIQIFASSTAEAMKLRENKG